METQAIEAARCSRRTAISAHAHGTRRGGRALVDQFSHAPPHRFARLPSEDPRQEMRIVSGSIALDRASCRPLARASARVRPRCVRPTSATQTFFGEHSRLVVLPVLRCKGASRERNASRLPEGGGPFDRFRAYARSRASMGLGPVDAARPGRPRGSRRAGIASADRSRFHGGRCRPGRCGSIEPLTPLSHLLAPASWKREAEDAEIARVSAHRDMRAPLRSEVPSIGTRCAQLRLAADTARWWPLSGPR